jgi:serine/threonine protein kinase
MSSRRIGNYQITDYVGSGGFGSVFKAEDVNTPGRIVAIKELHKKHTRNQVIKQRFFQEAVAMARLDHPNLPRLYTFGEDNGSYYLVMEFISGKLLSDEIREKEQMHPDRAVSVLTQVLDAVSYAHRNGIIHRDLKPDNIILVGDGSSLRIKVLDFGIARMIGGESLTLAGEGFGTPTYMAPERMTGAAGDDPRMDLYAAGIILFEMLTGKAPFESKATDPAIYWVEMRELHQRGPLPDLAPLAVPQAIERIAQRATAKALDDRYQSADEMLEDLRSLRAISADAPTVVLSNSRLLLSTTPGGAEVYVDDLLRGTSDSIKGKLLVDGLTAGLHSVRVLKEGFNEYRINVALEEGRQTDLQVAIPARATVAMPASEDTAASGLDTLRFQSSEEIKTAVLSDETKTAVLIVESLPAGTTLFVGNEAMAHAGNDGRATVSLRPGSHQIRATSPSGATATRIVSVTNQDTGALKTISLPIAQTTVAGSAIAGARPEQSQRGKQLAAAAVVVLLLALAAAAYFVLRGPNRAQVESATNLASGGAAPAAPPQEPTPTTQPPLRTDAAQTADDKKKAAEARRQAEQEAAALEVQKKAAEAKAKADEKAASPQQPVTAVTVAPPAPAPPPAADPGPQPAAAARDGCVAVTVVDASGDPAIGAKVGVLDPSDGSRFPGRTGPKGHWQQCGLTRGHTVNVAVFGPMGAILSSQTAVIASPRTFVTFRLQRDLDESRPGIPDRKRPFRRRP